MTTHSSSWPSGAARHWSVLGVIAMGGVLGAEARYGAEQLVPQGGPWATLAVNVVGCVLIGALMVVVLELTAPHRLVRPFLGIGALGGFTTFSTYAVEVRNLLDDRPLVALGYLAATPVLAVVSCWVGAVAVRIVVTRRAGGHR